MTKPMKVWSHFENVPVQTGEEGYDFEVFNAADCGGTSEGDYDAMYTDGWAEFAKSIYSEIALDLQMMMDFSYSIALRDNMDSVISCCNIMSRDAYKLLDDSEDSVSSDDEIAPTPGLLGDSANRNSQADGRGRP